MSGSLPSSWNQMSKLKSFQAESNRLTGSLPSSWGDMSQVVVVSLGTNLLTGTLPESWSNMSQVQGLTLYGNKLTGSLPNSWPQMPQLEWLDLSNNSLTGSLPSSWANMSQISVSSNKLSRSLPGSLSSSQDCATLVLSHNALTGTLPASFGQQLTWLDLSYNNLTGTLPSSWGATNLGLLDLQGNSFTGTIPSSWSNMNLTYLNLAGNKLHGTLPGSWGSQQSNLKGLVYLSMRSNQLSGTLPAAWSNMSALKYLALASNAFSGSVPASWSNLSEVQYLSLQKNQLTGSIPVLAESVQLLHMSHNRLTRPTFSNLHASLKLLYLANNSLPGSMPSLADIPASLRLLDLSFNQLSGPLPRALPTNLSVLNISRNSLTGTLPGSWAAAAHLAEVRLDDNPVDGTLPSTWGSLGKQTKNSLQLSLVNTSLHGHVPRQWVNQFCLAIDQSGIAPFLFEPSWIQLYPVRASNKSLLVYLGDLLQLPAQHANINVTLGHKLFNFNYGDPHTICGIPDATRNVAIMWGIFAALLLTTLMSTHLWLRRTKAAATSGWSAKLSQVKSFLLTKRLCIPAKLADRIWFFLTDVVYFMYSQITDAITIQQVFASGQLRYAYLLLGIVLSPYVFLLVLVCRTSIKMCYRIAEGVRLQAVAACFVGFLLAPITLLLLLLAMMVHGVGCPLPVWFQYLQVDIYTAYRAHSLAESFLNALPQSILQSKLYLLGNNPNGIHVYIDTLLYLYSIAGSFVSILKSIAFIIVDHHKCKCSFVEYCVNLFRLKAQLYGALP